MQRELVAKLIEMDPEWEKESTKHKPKVGSVWEQLVINVYGE
jgi:hypothetical protein